MQGHAFKRKATGGQSCAVCGAIPGAAIHLGTLDGMENVDQEREEARQLAEAAELTARMLEARPSIDSRTGLMEENSPLFYGKINATLF